MLQLLRDTFNYFLAIFHLILKILKLHRLQLKMPCVQHHIWQDLVLMMKVCSLFSKERIIPSLFRPPFTAVWY